MRKEKIKVEIESDDYDTKKEFNFQLMMDGKQFLDFVSNIISFIETNKLEEYQKPESKKQ